MTEPTFMLLPGVRLSFTVDPNTDMRTAHVTVRIGSRAVEVEADRLSVLGALAMLGVRDVEWPRTAEEGLALLGMPKRTCTEGGECEFTPDREYDVTGETINCEKCGEPPPEEP